MVKRESYIQEKDFTETGNWNVARSYSEGIIWRYIQEATELESIAEDGCIEFVEEFTTSKEMKDKVRLLALKRFIKRLIKIIDVCHFAIKNPKDRKELLETREYLEKLRKKAIPKVHRIKKHYDESVLKINEKPFSFLLEELKKTFRELKFPLNRSDLIYRKNENFNAKKYKKKLKERIINVG